MNYIIDLDGTILSGKEVNVDAKEFIEYLQAHHKNFVVMTNSVKSPQRVAERLSNVGIEIPTSQIMNPIAAMNIYLDKHEFNNVYVIGTDLEKDQVEKKIVSDRPEIILLIDFEKANIAYQDLQKVYEWMLQGIPVLTASKSKFYLSGPKKKLDTGAFVTLLEAASEKSIEVIGKPSKIYFQSALDKLDSQAEDVTVIGDDHSTDIKGAYDMGCQSVLLKTGKYKEGDEKKAWVIRHIDSFSEIM